MPPPIHPHNLASHKERIAQQPQHRRGNILRRAHAPERRALDHRNAIVISFSGVWPQHRARRDTIDAHARTKIARERFRHHRERRLAHAVHAVLRQRLFGVDIDDVDDRSAVLGKPRRGGLREEERRAHVRGEKFVPLRRSRRGKRRRIERRRVVDERIEPPVSINACADEASEFLDVAKIGLQTQRALRSRGFELGDQRIEIVA